jgi:hypothetical protein
MAYDFIRGGLSERAAIVAALANYLLFFAGFWASFLRSRALQSKQQARRSAFQASKPVQGQRVCAICSAREADGADIRVCTCAKCGSPRALCLEHARNH